MRIPEMISNQLSKFPVAKIRESRLLQVVFAGAIFFTLVLILGIYKYFVISAAIAQHASFAPPPDAVTSLVVKEERWPEMVSAVGSVAAPQGAILSFEEPGIVAVVNVESGAMIEAGQTLIALDSSVEKAQLDGARARLDLARQELVRVRGLRERNAVSKSDLDRAESEFRSADAAVNSLDATIRRKTLTAPFAGRAGIRQVNVGQYVPAGAEVLPLYSLNPLYVNFSLPQETSLRLKSGQKVEVTLSNHVSQRLQGAINAVNPQIDERTRNVAIQATVPNPEEILRPGMFVTVSLSLGGEITVIPVPSSSINYAPYGDTVFVIETMKDPAGKEYRGVNSVVVKLGPTRGEQVAVLSGLKPGQEIVTSGTFKLRPGGAVTVNNSFAPSNDPAPKAADI